MAFEDSTLALDDELDGICKRARILIVEDDPNYRFFLKQALSKQGYQNIEQAANGNEGYHKTLSYKPDIVILDLMMPICNGIEYCQRVRALPEYAEMPILVQTGVGDLDMHRKSFEAGATDLLTKPVNPEEFLARMLAHLERYELSRNIKNFRGVLKQEMDVADSIQRYFMPSTRYVRDIEKKFDLHISSYYQSSGLIGGDMWNAIALDENRLLLYACDFSGQGISSALQSMRYHMLLQRIAEETTDPGHALTHLNVRVREILETDQHTLMFIAVIDRRKKTLAYAGAGAPAPLLVNTHSHRLEYLPIQETPLGLREGESYASNEVPFEPSDSLFLYSDALFSTSRADGTCVTRDEAAEMARSCLMQATSIEEKHKAFHQCMCYNIEASNAVLADDLLLLLISRV